MKNIWKTEDITAGLYIIRESSPKNSPHIGFARTVTFKIGFSRTNEEKPYGKISCMCDGWYCPIGTKEQVAEYLNNDEYGYRPLTKEEFIKMINSSDQGFY